MRICAIPLKNDSSTSTAGGPKKSRLEDASITPTEANKN